MKLSVWVCGTFSTIERSHGGDMKVCDGGKEIATTELGAGGKVKVCDGGKEIEEMMDVVEQKEEVVVSSHAKTGDKVIRGTNSDEAR